LPILKRLSVCALFIGAQACFIFPRSAPVPAPKKTAAQLREDSIAKADSDAGLKPYDKVVTKAAHTRNGLFKTHRIGDTLLFEIPRYQLGRDMLLVGRFAAASGGVAFGGDEFTERVLRWDRQGNRILLRSLSFEITADSTLPVYQAVSQANYPPVVAVFNIKSFGPDSSSVIDVTPLYTTNVPEFTAARGSFDEKRSFIERATSFPENVEVEATQTFTPDNPPETQHGLGPVPAQSILAHWSMIRLPIRPMMPRLSDKRVGFYEVRQTDFGADYRRAEVRSYITRWRLEKKFPDSLLSEPVKPIVYYVDPATPTQWVPWVKRGIEDWQEAFEAAGFRNAIVARTAPSPAQDSDWSAEDIRNTVVRWLPSNVENADGPHVHDPRTGEILNGSIRIHQNVLNLARNWYFTQVAPLDPRAQRLPFPDSLMGRLLEYVVAHEVGHSLGFPHNFKASSTYPADSVRSRTWVARMGHTPTLMDYARMNYVAQPEDRIAMEDLVPRIGPYDGFAAHWGYAPVRGAHTPEDERATLDDWARMQDTIPWYRFSTSGAHDADPGDESEAVGDADPVQSTSLGLRNIRRTAALLMPATLRVGEDNSDLAELYDKLVDQWSVEMEHVVNVIGGSESREKYGGQLGPRFTPVSPARQRAALRFLADNAFHAPTYLLDAAVLRRLEPEGGLRRIASAQARVLAQLLDDNRLNRLSEYQALTTKRSSVYPLSEMLTDLRRDVWSELSRSRVTIDPFRRSLQRAWLAQADAKLNPTPAFVIQPAPSRRSRGNLTATPNTDVRGLMRGDLLALDDELKSAISRAEDKETRVHLIDARALIESILNPD
jgi:hypothetical protein